LYNGKKLEAGKSLTGLDRQTDRQIKRLDNLTTYYRIYVRRNAAEA